MRTTLLSLLLAAVLLLATACTGDGNSSAVYPGPANSGNRIP